jgi:hypothetical protein
MKPEEATEEFIDTWLNYIIDPYPCVSNDDQDIIAVMKGEKPISMTDGDCSYNLQDIDYKLRYFAAFKHPDIKLLNIHMNDDPTTIWYHKNEWNKALLLKQFHDGLHNEYHKSQFTFDVFQGYLLGYEYLSTIIYTVHEELEEDMKKCLNVYDTIKSRSEEEKGINCSEISKLEVNALSQATLPTKQAIYKIHYNKIQNTMKQYRKMYYDLIIEKINDLLNTITESRNCL